MKWLNKLKQHRLWKSKGGAVFMMGGYIALILMLDLAKVDFNAINSILGYLMVPGALLMTASSGVVVGVGWGVILLSMLMYGAVGYAIDYFYKPGK